MDKVTKGFEKARNKRFAEKEKEYGGKGNPKNWKNMSDAQLVGRVLDQAGTIDDLAFSSDSECDYECLKRELVDTANLCELAWRKLNNRKE